MVPSNTHLVSIIIPAYNAEAFVGRAIGSALQQTYSSTEVICVDDGSTDGTVEVLRDFASRYPQALHVIESENRGACAARNLGMSHARGAYLAFLDADDELDSDKLAHQMRLVTSAPTAPDLVCGSFERVLPDGSSYVVESGEYDDDWVNLVCSRSGITSANLWKASAVREAGGWNEEWKSSQETELMFRLLKNGAVVVYDREVKTQLHARDGSISFAFDEPLRIRHISLRGEIVKHLEGTGELRGERRDRILESVFKQIRGLHRLNPAAARELREQVLPRSYRPPVSDHNTLPYVVSMRLFGFRGAEAIRGLVKDKWRVIG